MIPARVLQRSAGWRNKWQPPGIGAYKLLKQLLLSYKHSRAGIEAGRYWKYKAI